MTHDVETHVHDPDPPVTAFDLAAVRATMKMTRSMDWTLDQDAELVRLQGRGKSYSAIGAALGKTRSAVCGRIRRLGLSKPAALVSRADRSGYQDRVGRKNAPTRANAPTRPPAVCIDVAPQGVSLMDLADKGCRYPDGDGPFTFCNHPIQDGSSYCPAHRALCWVKPLKTWRAAV